MLASRSQAQVKCLHLRSGGPNLRSAALAASFDLDAEEAREIAGAVGGAVAKWHAVARRLGAPAAEIERMASAFEHEDAELARG